MWVYWNIFKHHSTPIDLYIYYNLISSGCIEYWIKFIYNKEKICKYFNGYFFSSRLGSIVNLIQPYKFESMASILVILFYVSLQKNCKNLSKMNKIYISLCILIMSRTTKENDISKFWSTYWWLGEYETIISLLISI